MSGESAAAPSLPPHGGLDCAAVFAGAAASLALFALWTYTLTLLPGLSSFGDVAKFQFTGRVLGIPHPPFFPAYVLLNHLFGQLPVQTLAYRVNLLSAVLAALTVLALGWLVFVATGRGWAAFAAAALFAWSLTLWSQAVQAGTHPLQVLLFTLALGLLWRWETCGSPMALAGAGLLIGTALWNHWSMLALVPALLLLAVLRPGPVLARVGRLGLVVGALLVPAVQLLYLRWALARPVVYAELDEATPEAIWRRARVELAANVPPGPDLVLERVGVVCGWWVDQATWVGLALGLAGLVLLARHRPRWAALEVAALLGVFAQQVNNLSFNAPAYGLPAYALLAFGAGWALAAAEGAVQRWRRDAWLARLPAVAALTLAATLFWSHLPLVDQSGRSVDAFLDEFIDDLPPRSLVLSPSYHWYEALFYKLRVERRRADADLRLLYGGWLPHEATGALAEGRPAVLFERLDDLGPAAARAAPRPIRGSPPPGAEPTFSIKMYYVVPPE